MCLGNCRCRLGGAFCTVKAQTGMELYWLCHQYQKNVIKCGTDQTYGVSSKLLRVG